MDMCVLPGSGRGLIGMLLALSLKTHTPGEEVTCLKLGSRSEDMPWVFLMPTASKSSLDLSHILIGMPQPFDGVVVFEGVLSP